MAQTVRVRHNGQVTEISALTLDETHCGGAEFFSQIALQLGLPRERMRVIHRGRLLTPESISRVLRDDPAAIVAGYREAAEQGSADAQFMLGMLMIHGRGTPADPAGGRAWLDAERQGTFGQVENRKVLVDASHGLVVRDRRWQPESARFGDERDMVDVHVRRLQVQPRIVSLERREEG